MSNYRIIYSYIIKFNPLVDLSTKDNWDGEEAVLIETDIELGDNEDSTLEEQMKEISRQLGIAGGYEVVSITAIHEAVSTDE